MYIVSISLFYQGLARLSGLHKRTGEAVSLGGSLLIQTRRSSSLLISSEEISLNLTGMRRYPDIALKDDLRYLVWSSSSSSLNKPILKVSAVLNGIKLFFPR